MIDFLKYDDYQTLIIQVIQQYNDTANEVRLVKRKRDFDEIVE